MPELGKEEAILEKPKMVNSKLYVKNTLLQYITV